jgi:ParB family transcriptional regulator, chromosome partitioning protein
MARKNLLSGLTDLEDTVSEASVPTYPIRGASKSMIRSVNDLARQADAYLEGEHVLDLDPSVIDVSFVADRMEDNQEHYRELFEAIRENGQNSPILVRPHPDVDGRYMIVFGHRRVRVAKELGRKVKAVVKAIDNKAHVIAQGQENSARANLSFIEKATFARRLEELEYSREVICAALASNEAAVSKMVSVVTRIPALIIRMVGSAPNIGRERWVALSLLVSKKSDVMNDTVSDPEFNGLDSNERFERLFAAVNRNGKQVRKAPAKLDAKAWAPADKTVIVTVKRTARKATVTLGQKDGLRFADFITGQLDDLYEAFRKPPK